MEIFDKKQWAFIIILSLLIMPMIYVYGIADPMGTDSSATIEQQFKIEQKEIANHSSIGRAGISSATTDIPTLVIGDTWEYDTLLNVTSTLDTPVGPIPLDGNISEEMNYSVGNIERIDANGTETLCYRIDFSGESIMDVSGMDGNVHAVMDFVLTGSEYRSVADLSLIGIDTFRNGTLRINSPWWNDISELNITSNETWNTPLEEYDFPISPEEGWNQTFSRSMMYSGDVMGNPIDSQLTEKIVHNNSCNETTSIKIMGENLDAFLVEIDDGAQIKYFSPEARANVMTNFNSGKYLDLPGLMVEIKEGKSELISFALGNYSYPIQLEIPPVVTPDSTVLISGTLTGGLSGNVHIEIPGTGMSVSTTLEEGSFSRNVLLDRAHDNTPTEMDVGSHGVVVYRGEFDVLAVSTITLADPEVSIFSANMSARPFSGVYVGAEVNVSAEVINPSIVPIQNLEIRIEDNGKIVLPDRIVSLAPLDRRTIFWNWTIQQAGNHTFTVILDPDNLYAEKIEDNNIAYLLYRVSEKPIPGFVNVTPVPGNITLHENDVMLFSAKGVDPDGTTPSVEWRLDGEIITVYNNTFQYHPDFNSSGNHTLNVIAIDQDEPYNISMRTRLEWHIDVFNANRFPIAVINAPLSGSQYRVGEPVNFSGNRSLDPDIARENVYKILNFTWNFGDGTYGNGIEVYHSFENTGIYEVRLNVSDPEGVMNFTSIYMNITERVPGPGEIPNGSGDENESKTNDDSDTSDLSMNKSSLFFGLGMVLIPVIIVIIVVRKRRKIQNMNERWEGEDDFEPTGTDDEAKYGKPVLREPSLKRPLVECDGLKKSFKLPGGGDYPVLKEIDLKLMPGEFVTLMGPSGSGKSTLLNVIGAMIPSSGGLVKVNGKSLGDMDYGELTSVRRNDVGWIFQDFNLIENLTALENIIIPMNLAGKVDPDVELRAKQLLELVGLGDRMGHFPDTLSGGQQQRVAAARALVNDPPLILADEPTGNLDSASGNEIIELFKKLAKEKKGILMVTHDIELARASDRVYIIRNGRLEESLAQEVRV